MGKAEGAWWGLHEGCASTWGHQGEPNEWSVHPSQVYLQGQGVCGSVVRECLCSRLEHLEVGLFENPHGVV